MNSIWIPLLASAAFGWCYYRLLRGTAIPAGSLLGAATAYFVLVYPQAGKILTGVLVAAAVVIEIDFRRRRNAYQGSEMVFEGGGIRRGLTPPEVGALFELPEDALLTVGLVELLDKGLIEYEQRAGAFTFQVSDVVRLGGEILNPAEKMRARKAAARAANQVLTSTEDILIELIGQQEGQPVSELSSQVWARQLRAESAAALGGFDPEKSKEYYDAYITHRLTGVAAGHFRAADYTGWMTLAWAMGMLTSPALKEVVKRTRPEWLHEDENLLSWLEGLHAAVSS